MCSVQTPHACFQVGASQRTVSFTVKLLFVGQSTLKVRCLTPLCSPRDLCYTNLLGNDASFFFFNFSFLFLNPVLYP